MMSFVMRPEPRRPRAVEEQSAPRRHAPIVAGVQPACSILALLPALFLLLAGVSRAIDAPPIQGDQRPAPSGSQPTTTARVLFLRADFPDEVSTRSPEDFHNDRGEGLIDRLVAYYDEVSRGRFRIEPILTDRVYRLPQPRRRYVSRPAQLIADATRLAARPEPAGERSLLEALDPDIIFVFFAGPGAESDIERGRPGLPWSNGVRGNWSLPFEHWTQPRGVVVGDRPMHDLSPFGVMAHEFGHALDLPELYAPGKTHEGIGIWGLMGQGTWVGRGDHPPHLSAWSKLRLGWVDALEVDSDRTIELPEVRESGLVVKILARRDRSPGEYFLIENRRRSGADRGLPGEGLLIWHVDESRASFRRSQDEPQHKRLDLETADGWPSDLDRGHSRGGNRGDAGDPFGDRDLAFGPTTRPGSGAYDGSPGRFSIRNVSPAGPTMRFDIVFEEESPAPEPQPTAPRGN